MQDKLEKRIQYHQSCLSDIHDHVIGVWLHYERETRSGLDEHQLSVLLTWRKEEVAAANALKHFHELELKFLKGLTNV